MKTANFICLWIITIAAFLTNASICPASQNFDPSTAIEGNTGDSYIVVWGTNDQDPTDGKFQDVKNVQWALDNIADGGTLQLKGTFYFGRGDLNKIYYYYYIEGCQVGANIGRTGKSVKIIGEKDESGNHLTEIIGGVDTFSSGFDNPDPFFGLYSPRKKPFVNIEIHDIHFKDFFASCLTLMGYTGLKVTGCKFTGGILLYSGSEQHPLAMAMAPGSWRFELSGFPGYDGTNSDASGEVLIKDNYFDGQGMSYDPLYDDDDNPIPDIRPDGVPEEAVYFYREGIGGRWYTGMSNGIAYISTDTTAKIENNEVYDILSTPISSIDNLGNTKIKSNKVTTTSHSWSGNCILVSYQTDTQIKGNEIETFNYGIFLWGGVYDSIIKDNKITVTAPGRYGIWFYPRQNTLGEWHGSDYNLILKNEFNMADLGTDILLLAASYNQVEENDFSTNNDSLNISIESFYYGFIPSIENTIVAGSWKGTLTYCDYTDNPDTIEYDGANNIIVESFKGGIMTNCD